MDQVTDCVASIEQHLHDIDKECLVISNSGYTAEDLEEFQNKLIDVKIVDAHGNLGYAGGVNTGIKHAKGEFIYVLNPDCLLTDSNIIQMMVDLNTDSTWAIAGPKVIDESNAIQPSCRRFPKLWTFLLVRSILSKLPGASKEKARYLMEDFDRKSIKNVDWVSGGAILVKSSAIQKMGGMDERYFLYMEDVDWCRSCWLNGFTVKYNPVSSVIHAGQHQSISGGLKEKLMSRHVRMHLSSMIKYFIKYKFKTYNIRHNDRIFNK